MKNALKLTYLSIMLIFTLLSRSNLYSQSSLEVNAAPTFRTFPFSALSFSNQLKYRDYSVNFIYSFKSKETYNHSVGVGLRLTTESIRDSTNYVDDNYQVTYREYLSRTYYVTIPLYYQFQYKRFYGRAGLNNVILWDYTYRIAGTIRPIEIDRSHLFEYHTSIGYLQPFRQFDLQLFTAIDTNWRYYDLSIGLGLVYNFNKITKKSNK